MSRIENGMLGFIIGDMLGLPVIDFPREYFELDAYTDLACGGKYQTPVGSYSDATALSLALMSSLSNGLNYSDIMFEYLDYLNNAKYNCVTKPIFVETNLRTSLTNYSHGHNPVECGTKDDTLNSNVGLKRMLPLAFYLAKNDFEEQLEYKMIEDITSFTNNQITSKVASCIYVMIAKELLLGKNKMEACRSGIQKVVLHYINNDKYQDEIRTNFKELINMPTFVSYPEKEIKSTDYVVDSLKTVLWCFVNSFNFKGAVLKCVNLGGDTATNAALCGGLAGIFYGIEEVPYSWMHRMINKEQVKEIITSFEKSFEKEVEYKEQIHVQKEALEKEAKEASDEESSVEELNADQEASTEALNTEPVEENDSIEETIETVENEDDLESTEVKKDEE